ncbi:MAG: hypothetical protein K1X83_02075 [Oligoflexia bacterium]|nr:hypothetical protein [Oligoflexia bacterium]
MSNVDSSSAPPVLAAHSLVRQLQTEYADIYRTLQEFGDYSMARYAAQLFPAGYKASEAIAKAANRVAAPIFGKKLASEIENQLLSNAAVSTASHHGLFSHLSIFQGDVLSACGAKRSSLQSAVVFSFAGVRLNNPSYPRGIEFNGKRFPLFSDSMKHTSVHFCPALDAPGWKRLPEELQRQLSPRKQQLLSMTRFSDQVSLINYEMSLALAPLACPIVYLSAEDIAVELLSSELMQDTSVARIMLNAADRAAALKMFEGVSGAWSSDGKGSQLCWGVSEGKRSCALRVQGDFLIGEDIKVELSAQSLIDALRRGEIYPGMLITFLLFLEHGIVCQGGFYQVAYLPEMKTRFLRYLAHSADSETLRKLPVSAFCTGPLFILGSGWRALGISDLILDTEQTLSHLQRGLEQLSFRDALILGSHRIYDMLFSAEKRLTAVADLSLADLGAALIAF